MARATRCAHPGGGGAGSRLEADLAVRPQRRADRAAVGSRPSRIAWVSAFSSVRRTWRFSGRAPNCSSKPSRASRATSAASTSSAMPRSSRSRAGGAGDHDARDLLDLRRRERVERHDLVDPVQELGQERLLGGGEHPRPRRRPAAAGGEAEPAPGLARAQVRRHHHDGVREVDRAALAVGQPAVVHELEQHVPDLGVGLLDLVEQDHGVRPPAHGLGQLPALAVADVAGRRADQPRHRVRRAELGHVDPDERLLGREQPLGERLDQLGLADAGRARGTGTSRAACRRRTGPTRARRTVSETSSTACSCPITRACRSASRSCSRSSSPATSSPTGIPVRAADDGGDVGLARPRAPRRLAAGGEPLARAGRGGP